jgi:hypothetical protein
MQSSETGLPTQNREFFENFSQNRLSEGRQLLASGNSAVIQVSYTAVPALSCYSAKQAFEARQQAMQCSTSGFFEPQSR